MKKLAILLVLIALLTMAVGCSAPAEEPQADEPAVEAPVEAEEANGFEGTWVGDGSLDIMGLDHEIEFVHTWTFRADKTVTAQKTVDGKEETLEFEYKYTEDTLTFIQGDATCGIGYTLEGDTLTIRTGIDTYAVYTRQ